MRPEILNRNLNCLETVNSCGNGDSEKVRTYLATILEEGKNPVDIVTEIWIDTFRGNLPTRETSVVVNELVDSLPKEMQNDLESVVGRGGVTQLSLARERAETQVEKERKVTMVQEAQIQKQTEERKKPSKGMAKHIRRVKAAKRRSGVLPKS